ncbi:MAG: PP2C family protein-serine/threonine phosphatase [FCB group bacterium]|jgi:sigma-B regulation protein RsbU (phosphoserine phosphatase)
MQNNNFKSQRNTYKLLEKITSQKFKSELSLLKTLVQDLVNHKEFGVIGGRIWQINPVENVYSLKYQFGNLKKIPSDYSLAIDEQPILNKLIRQRTITNVETDPLLQSKGIDVYSLTGVGEILKLKSGKYYKYAIGFNAPEILQTLNETLNILSGVTSVALRNLTAQAAHKKIRRDIVKASEIQRNLLPDHKIKFYDYDVFGICIPDSEVSGDYFDYLKNADFEEERLGIVISDASSKGLPAAVQSLFLSGAMRMGLGFATKMSSLFSRLNTLIWETFPNERFVTLFYCELTLSSNRLALYTNAGHCSPIHYHPDTDEIKFLGPTGGMLGVVENQKFGVENIRMRPGDVLILYTDGITESQDNMGNMFGEDRLIELIKKYHSESPEAIAYNILEEVQKFTIDSLYSDDKTLVVVKRDSN